MAAPSPGRLQAAAVLEDARAAMDNRTEPAARYLVQMVRLCFESEDRALRYLQRALDQICWAEANQPPADATDAQPSGRRLWRAAADLLNADIRRSCRFLGDPGAWRLAESLRMAEYWLGSAARIAEHDAAALRGRGAKLMLPTLPHSKVRGQLLPAGDAAQPDGQHLEVLRLTWHDTGRIVAQSMPGQWHRLDTRVEPS
jgi:hypothetical protein